MTRIQGKGHHMSPNNVTEFPENVTQFPENVTRSQNCDPVFRDCDPVFKNVTHFPKIYDKLYDKKVLGILIGDPVSQKCDLFLKMWPGFLKMLSSVLKM